MASSSPADNMMMTSIESWAFRPTFENSWISEAFTRDTEILTKALQHVSAPSSQQQQGQSVSSSGGSEPETVSKRKAGGSAPPSGKIAKRKSRASKRSPTTFITADPANFRQMVQQVTGVRFVPGQVGSVLKPEPQRLVNRVQGGYLMPTLDTSAFLLDHVGPGAVTGGAQGSIGYGPPAVVADGGGPGLDFDGFSCFPTLESWKVM